MKSPVNIGMISMIQTLVCIMMTLNTNIVKLDANFDVEKLGVAKLLPIGLDI